MHRNRFTFVGAVVLCVAWLGASVVAQELATLKVTVQDQSGAVIPGATVSVKKQQTGAQRTDITESHGLSVIPGLPPGAYTLSTSVKGFSPKEQPVSLSV